MCFHWLVSEHRGLHAGPARPVNKGTSDSILGCHGAILRVVSLQGPGMSLTHPYLAGCSVVQTVSRSIDRSGDEQDCKGTADILYTDTDVGQSRFAAFPVEGKAVPSLNPHPQAQPGEGWKPKRCLVSLSRRPAADDNCRGRS